MENTVSKKTLGLLTIIGAVAIIAIIGMSVASYNEPPQVNVNTTDEYNTSGDNLFRVEKNDSETHVYGKITGDTGGQNVVIESVEVEDGVVVVDIGLQESDGIATQVITEYPYKLELANPEQYRTLRIEHNGKEKKVINLDSEVAYNLERQSVELNHNKSIKIESSSDKRTVLSGTFYTGSSSCSRVALDRFELVNNSLMINLSPGEIDRQICTADIAKKPYRLTIQHYSLADTAEININQSYGDDIQRTINLLKDNKNT